MNVSYIASHVVDQNKDPALSNTTMFFIFLIIYRDIRTFLIETNNLGNFSYTFSEILLSNSIPFENKREINHVLDHKIRYYHECLDDFVVTKIHFYLIFKQLLKN